MKAITFMLLFTLLGYTTCFGQTKTLLDSIPVDSATGMVKYEEVINVPGTKDQLFKKAQFWMATGFNPVGSATTIEDKDAKSVSAKVIMPYEYIVYYGDNVLVKSGKSLYTMSIYTKDNKCKYVISDIILQDNTNKIFVPWSKAYLSDISNEKAGKTLHSVFSTVDFKLRFLINDLKRKMSAKAPNDF